MTRPRSTPPERKALPEDAATLQEFENLLSYLKQSRGFDFTAYKRSSLMRRTLVRMQTIGVFGFANYQDYLQVDPEEFTRLFNTILINVTGFFRDPPAWEYLASDVLPDMIGPDGATHSIRVWSAGSASGEEAYTIAILLAERLGLGDFRERVKIYATDVDEEALNEARMASYEERSTRDVPPELLRKYFEQQNGRFIFSKELRRSVIFGRHNLIQDAPISRVNLLICRNCLMYFNAETQGRILSRFQFALLPGGVLFLGRAETLLSRAATFAPVDVKRRIFVKQDRKSGTERPTDGFREENGIGSAKALRDAAADLGPVAMLVVDRQGVVLQANQQLRSLFGLTARDVGRPLQDLELSYRPFELRSSLEQAYNERHPVIQTEATWLAPGGHQTYLDLQIVPVPDPSGFFVGAVITFIDVTRVSRLRDELQRTSRELETALEELQSTNEELRTTNEALQSTVEELETTNEELQSTNEELETMNEELQSTNEELQTINVEVKERSDEFSDLNAFLESIFTSLRGGVAVVDRDLQVRKWNSHAEDMWGLRGDEAVHKNFLNLDIGLPTDQLRTPLRNSLAGEPEEIILDATNPRGKPWRLKVTCTPLVSPTKQTVSGVILLMEPVDGRPLDGRLQ
jgi:two-component system, chemotaxis family, CheB/CheR fusion protein